MRKQHTVQIVERQGRTVRIVGESGRGRIEVIAEMAKEGNTLILRDAHVEGAGAGSMGTGELRAFARALGKQQEAETVVIHGGRRTTGANPGRVPEPIEFEVG